jgi:hypothetical protein
MTITQVVVFLILTMSSIPFFAIGITVLVFRQPLILVEWSRSAQFRLEKDHPLSLKSLGVKTYETPFTQSLYAAGVKNHPCFLPSLVRDGIPVQLSDSLRKAETQEILKSQEACLARMVVKFAILFTLTAGAAAVVISFLFAINMEV